MAINGKSKLDENIDRYREIREELKQLNGARTLAEEAVLKANQKRDALDAEIRKKRLSLRQVGEKLPGLIGSDMAGFVGQQPEEP